jgi:ABC-type antimicrobial peptide transport system permease subunit
LTFILVPIRYDYEQTAPFEKYDFDIFVNGLITLDDYNKILRDQNITQVASASYGRGNVYKGQIQDEFVNPVVPVKNALILNSDTLIEPSKLNLIGVNKFIISGELRKNDIKDYAAIDWNMAKKLNAQIGDEVTYWIGEKKFEFEVSAITVPTTETEFIFETNPNLLEYMESFGSNLQGMYAGNLYIKSKNPESSIQFIKSYMSNNGKDWVIKTKDAMKAQVLKNLEGSLPDILRSGLMVGGLFIYLVVLLREQNIVVSRRKRNFSILTALGIKQTELMNIYILEQIYVMIIVGVFSLLITNFFIYNTLFSLYLPIEVLTKGGILGFILNILAIIITLLFTKMQLTKTPTAVLLSEER